MAQDLTISPAAVPGAFGRTRFVGPAAVATRATDAALRVTVKPALFAATQLGWVVNAVDPTLLQRTSLAGLDAPPWLSRPVRGTLAHPVQLPSCRAEWIVPQDPTRRTGATVVYFHGSAFIALGLNSHRPFVSRLVRATGAQVLNVAYALRPQADLETALQDAVDGYQHVLDSGADPTRIVLAGDSAGGFLAAALAIRLRELGLPRPAGQVLFSPGTDSALAPKLASAKRRPDAMFPVAMLRFLWRVYISRNGTHAAEAGPTDLDLSGLAPFLIQVGSTEMLRPDAELLTARLRAAGVRCELQIWDRAPHVFQVSGPINPDARAATRAACGFIRTVTDTDRPHGARPRRGLRLVRLPH